MYQLTEENIKKITLGFLRDYYKNNSSRGFGESEIRLNMTTEDGIIADGYMKFSVSDSSLPGANLNRNTAEEVVLEKGREELQNKDTFLATFEATSQNTAEEIQYQLQNTLLFFDALSVASIIAAGSYGYNYLNDQFTLNQLGHFWFIAGFLGVMIASFIAYILIFRKIPRYRHIYALAQFNRYQANEQWVSYGEDVFEYSHNKYLKELKKQCVRQGFGLIAIDKELTPALVITPRRKADKKSRHRKIRQFFSGYVPAPVKKANQKLFGKIPLPTINISRFFKWQQQLDTADYTRFTQSYWKQALVILAMGFVIGEIYLEERKNPNIAYIEENEKYEEILRKKLDENKETTGFVPIEKIEEEQLKEEAEEEVDSEITDKQASNAPQRSSTPLFPPPDQKQAGLIINAENDKIATYPCNRLSGLKGSQFIVQLTIVGAEKEAAKEVKRWTKAGYNASAIWLGCFTNDQRYVVYLDDIYQDKTAAVNRANNFTRRMKASNYPQEAILRTLQGQ